MAKTPDKKPTDKPDDEKTEAAKTEQEKAGVGSAQEPYPEGNPPDPEDTFEQAHGFRRTPKKE